MIWILGLLALCGQVGEGSAGDWSAVYLHVNLGSSAAVAAVALGAFSVTMAAGRVAGDRLAARFGPVRLVRASGLVAGLGLAAGLLIGTPAAAIAGFALLGLGLAGIFPQIVTAAARLDPGHAGRNIGRIAAVALLGPAQRPGRDRRDRLRRGPARRAARPGRPRDRRHRGRPACMAGPG